MTDFKALLELIPKGKENAISRKQLGTLIGETQREVSRTIHNARKAGHIICSSAQGYYKPQTDEELVEGYDKLWGPSISILSSLNPMRARLVDTGLIVETKEYKSRHKENE